MIWILLFVGLYPYLIYPVLMWGLGFFVSKPVHRDCTNRSVTVVIAAHNEVNCIVATINNKLEQDYPALLLNIIVVSDDSDDGTDEIVEKICAVTDRVTLLRQVPRQGKTAALNMAIAACDSELVVFSDANSLYASDAVTQLVSCFGDPDVGYVSGKMTYVSSKGSIASEGSGAYMRYENKIRSWETAVGSVVGVDGGIDAVRRTLYAPMRPDQLPDFVLPLSVAEKGYRVVFEPSALLREDALHSLRDEFQMRIRVTTRALWALIEFRHLLNPFKTGLISFQLLSHKWLRYFGFVPLTLAAGLAVFNNPESVQHWLLATGVLLFSLLASIGALFPKLAESTALVRFPAYFAMINIASAVAFVKVLVGERYVIWRPRVG